MRVLITGNKGYIGKHVENELIRAGFSVVGYDIIDGYDILCTESLTKQAIGCQVIVHLAAIEDESPIRTMETNLLGTWSVLCAAKKAKVEKIVYLSSVDSLGIFQGEGVPEYLPIDDDYPCHPKTPYSISKKLSEEMCFHFNESTGTTIICIRPPGVWDESTYHQIESARQARPEYEWDPFWEYGAFIDVRDLSEAVVASIKNIDSGFHCYLVASNDITTSGKSSKQLVQKLHPNVKWNGSKEYDKNLYKSLVITENARTKLKWSPKYSWKRFIDQK